MTSFNSKAGPPPGQKSKTLVGQDEGLVKLLSNGPALQPNNSIVRTLWDVYFARRSLQRNRQSGRWPDEVIL